MHDVEDCTGPSARIVVVVMFVSVSVAERFTNLSCFIFRHVAVPFISDTVTVVDGVLL